MYGRKCDLSYVILGELGVGINNYKTGYGGWYF